MDLITARAKAVSEMKKHGLIRQGWQFEFDRAIRRLGQCDFTKKRITLSKHFTGAANEEQFEQALLHEIAHALLPVGAKHGWDWRLKAREIGYRGVRLASNPYSAYRDMQDAVRRAQGSEAEAVAGDNDTQGTQKGTPKTGDTLVLPNGAELTVAEVTTKTIKAVDVAGIVWHLDSPEAYQFLKR